MDFLKDIANNIFISEIQKQLNIIKDEINKKKEEEEKIKKSKEEILKKIKP